MLGSDSKKVVNMGNDFNRNLQKKQKKTENLSSLGGQPKGTLNSKSCVRIVSIAKKNKKNKKNEIKKFRDDKALRNNIHVQMKFPSMPNLFPTVPLEHSIPSDFQEELVELNSNLRKVANGVSIDAGLSARVDAITSELRRFNDSISNAGNKMSNAYVGFKDFFAFFTDNKVTILSCAVMMYCYRNQSQVGEMRKLYFTILPIIFVAEKSGVLEQITSLATSLFDKFSDLHTQAEFGLEEVIGFFSNAVTLTYGSKFLKGFSAVAILRELKGFKNSKEDTSSFITDALLILQKIYNYMIVHVMGIGEEWKLKSDSVEVESWRDELVMVSQLSRDGKFEICQDNYEHLQQLEMRSMSFMARPVKNASDSRCRMVVSSYKSLLATMLKEFEAACVSGNAPRVEPMGVLLLGKPGCGKSTAIQPLIVDLLKAVLPEHRLPQLAKAPHQFIYNRCAEHQYWDGYYGQTVTVFDDFGQLVDTPGGSSEGFDIIRAINMFPMICHMAHLEQKGNTRFTSKVVFASSNAENLVCNTVREQAAVTRRFNLAFKVTIKPEFVVGGRGTMATALDTKLVNEPFNELIYDFQRVDYSNNNSTIGSLMSYSDVVNLMISEYNRRELAGRSYNEMLLSRARMDPLHVQMDTPCASMESISLSNDGYGTPPRIVPRSVPVAEVQQACAKGLLPKGVAMTLLSGTQYAEADFWTPHMEAIPSRFVGALQTDHARKYIDTHNTCIQWVQEFDLDISNFETNEKDSILTDNPILGDDLSFLDDGADGELALIDPESCQFYDSSYVKCWTQVFAPTNTMTGKFSVYTKVEFWLLWCRWRVEFCKVKTFADFERFSEVACSHHVFFQRPRPEKHVLQAVTKIIERWDQWAEGKFFFKALTRDKIGEKLEQLKATIPDVIKDNCSSAKDSFLELLHKHKKSVDFFVTFLGFYSAFVGIEALAKTCKRKFYDKPEVPVLEDESMIEPNQVVEFGDPGEAEGLVTESNVKMREHKSSRKGGHKQKGGFQRSGITLHTQGCTVEVPRSDLSTIDFSKLDNDLRISNVYLDITRSLKTQGGWNSVHESGIDKIWQKNMIEVHSSVTSTQFGYALAIRDDVIIVNRHFLYYYKSINFDVDYTRDGFYFKHEARKMNVFVTLQVLKDADFSNHLKHKDLLMFHLPDVPAFPDITNMFVDDNIINKLSYTTVRLLVPEKSGGIRSYFVTAHKYSSMKALCGEDQIEYTDCIGYNLPTKYGWCGSVLMSEHPSVGPSRIIGIHSAGTSESFGVATTISRQDIMRDPVVVQAGGISMPFQGNFTPIRVIPTPVQEASKSKIERSLMFAEVSVPKRRPAKLKPFIKDNQIVVPKYLAIMKYGNKCPDVNLESLIIAGDLYGSRILDQLYINPPMRGKAILTFEQAVLGVEGDDFIASLPRQTSSGFPYNSKPKLGFSGKEWFFGKGQDYDLDRKPCRDLKSQCLGVIDAIKKGSGYKDFEFVYTDTLKDETRPIEKVLLGKTRLISASPIDLSILTRMYFMSFCAFMMENNIRCDVAIGVNPYGMEWSFLRKVLTSKSQFVVAGDFSNHDGTVHEMFARPLLNIINQWYDDGPVNNKIREVLWLNIFKSKHICYDFIYQWHDCIPSGSVMTTVVNSMYDNLIFRAIWLDLHPEKLNGSVEFNEKVALVTYGDDNVLNIAEDCLGWFNQHSIGERAKHYGMTYTSETKGANANMAPYRNLSEVTFLKRRFRFEESFDRWVAPIELDSLLEPLNWVLRSVDDLENSFERVNNALEELSMHEEEVFNEYAPKIIKACQRCLCRNPTLTSRNALISRIAMRSTHW